MLLRPQTATQSKSELVRVDLADIRAQLGLAGGGQEALLAMALLTGGDYDVAGLANVGKAGAMLVICHLLKGRQVNVLDSSQLAHLTVLSCMLFNSGTCAWVVCCDEFCLSIAWLSVCICVGKLP